MKRILFPVVFLLPFAVFGPEVEKADREAVSAALRQTVQNTWNHAQKKLEETFPPATPGQPSAHAREFPPDGDNLTPPGVALLWEEQSAYEQAAKDRVQKNKAERIAVLEDFLRIKEMAAQETPFIRPDMTKQQQRDFYATTLRGKKRFLILETNHRRENFISQYSEILRTVRKINPHARILLALEFLRNTKTQALPIQFYDEKQKEDLFIFEDYKKLLADAKKFKIDVLALDDTIFYEYPTTWKDKQVLLRAVQVGDELLPVFPYPPGDQASRRALSSNDISHFEYAVKGMYWGVQQRNKQWAERIRAVENYYDIVLVLAGNGHYGLAALLPPLENESEMGELYFHYPFTKEEEEKNRKQLKQEIKNIEQQINILKKQEQR